MTKHFLYLTNDKLIALIWRGGAIVERDVFNATDADSAEFTAYIARHREDPTYVVTDLIEEDFRIDTVPHLRGGDQEAILGRKLAQLYRASNYRHAVVQERETEGRRDDRVLYHAITNPDLVKPWLAALERAEVPLEGVYSSAVLSARLPKELSVFFAHTLLVTIIPDFGLRQTYFQNKHIKFSRLTPIIYDEGQSVGTLIAAETSRTWQYLDSLRFFAGGDTLEVCILVHARDREMVAEAIRTFPLLKYRFLDIEEVAAKIKLKPAPTSSHAEEVLVHLFAQGSIENHFAEKEQMRFARYRRTKIGLYGLTAGLLAIGAAGAAFNLYQTASMSSVVDQRSQIVRTIQNEYQIISNAMAGQTSASDTVRDASTFFRAQIRPQSPAPGTILKDLARVWSEFPEMRLLQVVWAPNQDPGFMPQYEPVAGASTQSIRSEVKLVPGAPPPAAGAGASALAFDADPPLPGSKYEVLIVDAAVTGFRGDYRAAIASIERAADRLNKAPNMKAEIVKLPIDVKPTAILRAGTPSASEASEVRFTLKIIRSREAT
ncbi:MAG: hypothetical protein ABI790_00350 [Betaproteobacteria bacterium]